VAGRVDRPPRYIAIVHRGETETYRMLKDYLEARGVAAVVWDRRVGDRRGPESPRTTGERRSRDRRVAAPTDPRHPLGFFIARVGPAAPGRTRAASAAGGGSGPSIAPPGGGATARRPGRGTPGPP
jgi:hypothetical protein